MRKKYPNRCIRNGCRRLTWQGTARTFRAGCDGFTHLLFRATGGRPEGEAEPLRFQSGDERAMKKVVTDAKAAIDGVVKNDMVMMAGGFGLCGIPEHLIDALVESQVTGLTVISNNCGVDGFGLGKLLEKRQIRKMVSSYVGENKLFAELFMSGELELEFNPQGTLAERIRAGGAGIPAFYTRTGYGTMIAEGKETRQFNGDWFVMETGLFADLAIVKAQTGDTEGNLIYRKTARNFNPMMATAATVTLAEVEELVEPGTLDADHIHTPGIFVNRILKGESFEKRIEQRTTRQRAA